MTKKSEHKHTEHHSPHHHAAHHEAHHHSQHPASETIETKLIENLVELQRINTHMAEKFDKLSDHIANLLALFESAARSFATQPHIQAAERDKEFLDKIDRLLDQNKTIAKGLTLLEQKLREKLYGPINPLPFSTQLPQRQTPTFATTPPRVAGMQPSKPVQEA